MSLFPVTPNKGLPLTGHTWLDPVIKKLDNPGGTGIGATGLQGGTGGQAVRDVGGAGGPAGASGAAGPGGQYAALGGPGGKGSTAGSAGRGGDGVFGGGPAGAFGGASGAKGGDAFLYGGDGGASGPSGVANGRVFVGTTHTYEVDLVASGGRFGAWGVSAIQQPQPSGVIAGGYSLGASGQLTTASTGGLGTKAYTFPELVAILKQLGFVAT